MKTFDEVVIGAGLAGLQCAKMLSERGAKIMLVGRKTDLTKGIHTTGIFVRTTFEDFDFLVGTLGKAVRKVRLFSPKLKSIDLESEKDEFRVGKMGLLYISLLKSCLDNSVEFVSGTRFIVAKIGTMGATGAQASRLQTSRKRRKTFHFQVSGISQIFSRSALIASGDACAPVGETAVKPEKNGVAFEVKTKVLVGADGAVSRVAKELKLNENKEWIIGFEEVYERDSNEGEPILQCFLDAKLAPGYLAWIADNSEEILIGVGGYPSVFNPREALKLFKNKTVGEMIDLRGAKLKETRGGRIPVGGVLKTIANSNGLLIGDAAGAVSPLTAGGLDPCLRLSAFAAEVIAESLQKNDPNILLNYSGKRFRSRFISRLWMRRIIAILTNQTLLKLGFVFLRRKLGRKFAKHVFFGRGSFPDVKSTTVKAGSVHQAGRLNF